MVKFFSIVLVLFRSDKTLNVPVKQLPFITPCLSKIVYNVDYLVSVNAVKPLMFVYSVVDLFVCHVLYAYDFNPTLKHRKQNSK